MTKEIIEQAGKNIAIINNSRQKELDIFWKTTIRDEVNSLPDGVSKRGGTKELNALIKSFENEIKENMELDNEILELFSSVILDYYEIDTNEDIKKLFNPLINIAELKHITPGSFFTWNNMELVTISVIHNIYNDIQFLKKHKKRFFENIREKNKAIENLKKSIDIAVRFNNQLLIYELENMINQIQEENFVTEEIIYKSCFYGLHQVLSEEFAKSTKAVDIANELLDNFFCIGKRYKPSKNIAEKEFFEHGYEESRAFIYYKS